MAENGSVQNTGNVAASSTGNLDPGSSGVLDPGNSGAINAGGTGNLNPGATGSFSLGGTGRRPAIIGVPAVARRLSRRSTFRKITSNGTIAAAAMVIGALLAILVANSPIYEIVREIIEAPLGITIGSFETSISVEIFVNDLLMSVFFLLVGIELKYEVTVGQLSKPRQAALPMLAAVGGVAVPAVIYLLFNQGPLADGWAIPIATDIAFALGIMSLLGRRISSATKVFFQTLAIADDILAIIVLALFYGTSLDIFWLAASVLATLALFLLNKASVYNVRWYAVVGSVLWVCMFNSGIHATLAGVIIAFALPAKSDIRLSSLSGWLNSQARRLEDSFDDESHVLGQHDFTHAATNVERIMHHVTPPLQRVEHNISVFVNFFVLPLFAFVNAQVRLVGVDMATIVSDPVAQGSFLGAVVGKPIGIILVTFVLVQIGFAKLPNRVTWDQIIAVGLLGGIGFTMSILISGLAFRSAAEVLAAKCAILAGSVAASAIGCAYVMLFGSRDKDGNPKQKPSE